MIHPKAEVGAVSLIELQALCLKGEQGGSDDKCVGGERQVSIWLCLYHRLFLPSPPQS